MKWRQRTRKAFEKPLAGATLIRRQDIVHLVGEVLAAAKLGDRDLVEDRVNQRLRSSETRKRKVNRLAPETEGVNRYKVSRVAVWASREWPDLDFSTAFAALEPATAKGGGTLGLVTLQSTVRLVPMDYETCKEALLCCWERVDELEKEIRSLRAGESLAE